MKIEFQNAIKKTELLVPSAWINPCYGINLTLIASLAIFKTMSRRSINIIELSQLGIGEKSILIVFYHCLQESESGGKTLWKNDWDMPHLICLFTSFFARALNFVFSKTKMFKLLFMLFVIKESLGNLTSDVDVYSAKQSIIQLRKAEWL